MASLVWLVTGCSSGFGQQFVRSLLARGDKVIATGRNIAKLSEIKDSGAHLHQLDVTATQDAIDKSINEALNINGRIDVLVNNTEYSEFGTVEDVPHDRWVVQYETNVFGPINVTRSLLPHFRKRRAGTVVFMGSMVGWKSTPVGGPYCSSKFALEGVFESFRQETTDLGIKSLLVEPGAFRTQLLSSENQKPIPTKYADYELLAGTALERLRANSGLQLGDTLKGVEVIIDVVKQEGKAAGRKMPERLPLGSDAVALLRAKCQSILQLLDEWEEIISSTDIKE